MNAKLAAKQFETLVKQFEGSNSPQSRNREKIFLSINNNNNNNSNNNDPQSSEGESPPLSASSLRSKRMSLAWRNQTQSNEKNYTESIWLQNIKDLNDTTSNTNSISPTISTSSNNSTNNTNNMMLINEEIRNHSNNNNINNNSNNNVNTIPESEKKKQTAALTLWRKSSGEINYRDDITDDIENEKNDKIEELKKSETKDSIINQNNNSEKNSQESIENNLHVRVEVNTDEEIGPAEWSPSSKNRKRRGTITRRR